jgi:adenylate cyclase
VAQIERMRQGLRVAGMREHAEEAANFGLPCDGILRCEMRGLTPGNVSGATTLRTTELLDLLSRQTPVLIDVAQDSLGRSLPDAIGLQGSGYGAAFSARIQSRLGRKIHELAKGDPSAPIVAYCANSERFTGYNLAMRLVGLGYTQVYWYRGGWEAWQVAGLSMTTLELQNW